MRLFFVLLCCCLLNQFLLSQSRFSYGINIQAGLSGKTKLEESHNSLTTTDTHRSRRHVFVPVVGVGVWGDYMLREKLSVQSGLQYVNSGNTEVHRGYTESRNTSRIISFHDYSYMFRAHQLQLPFEFKLELGQGQLKPVFSLGAQLSYEWLGTIYKENNANVDEDNRVDVTVWSRETRTMIDYRPLNLQPFIGFGFRLNEQMLVRLRHSWKFGEQVVRWGPSGFDSDFILRSPITVATYRTQTTHSKLFTIDLAYRLY